MSAVRPLDAWRPVEPLMEIHDQLDDDELVMTSCAGAEQLPTVHRNGFLRHLNTDMSRALVANDLHAHQRHRHQFCHDLDLPPRAPQRQPRRYVTREQLELSLLTLTPPSEVRGQGHAALQSDCGYGACAEVEYAEDDDDVRMKEKCSRPDRPDCVPKIDLSWTSDDERHVTRDVISTVQNGGPIPRDSPETVGCVVAEVGHGAKLVPSFDTPLTPRAPRISATPEEEMSSSGGSGYANDGCVSGSLWRLAETEGTDSFEVSSDALVASDDVISVTDISVDEPEVLLPASSSGLINYCAGADETAADIASVHVTAVSSDVISLKTGSSESVDMTSAESRVTTPPLPSPRQEIVRATNSEYCVHVESSPSVAERLLCTLCCCQLKMVIYRSRAAQPPVD